MAGAPAVAAAAMHMAGDEFGNVRRDPTGNIVWYSYVSPDQAAAGVTPVAPRHAHAGDPVHYHPGHGHLMPATHPGMTPMGRQGALGPARHYALPNPGPGHCVREAPHGVAHVEAEGKSGKGKGKKGKPEGKGKPSKWVRGTGFNGKAKGKGSKGKGKPMFENKAVKWHLCSLQSVDPSQTRILITLPNSIKYCSSMSFYALVPEPTIKVKRRLPVNLDSDDDDEEAKGSKRPRTATLCNSDDADSSDDVSATPEKKGKVDQLSAPAVEPPASEDDKKLDAGGKPEEKKPEEKPQDDKEEEKEEKKEQDGKENDNKASVAGSSTDAAATTGEEPATKTPRQKRPRKARTPKIEKIDPSVL